MTNPDGVLITDPHYEALLQGVFDLRAEVLCRIAYGAGERPCAGHLNYMSRKLAELCYPKEMGSSNLNVQTLPT